MKKLFFTFICALSFVFSHAQQDCGLDPSFGNEGEVLVDFIPGYPNVTTERSLSLNDGKLIVWFTSTAADYTTTNILVRFNEDGTMDTSFGVEGIVIYQPSIAGYLASLRDIKELEDGSLLATGSLTHIDSDENGYLIYHTHLFISKFNSDGSLCESFGENGTVTSIDFGNVVGFYDVVILDDGSVLASDCVDGVASVIKFNNDASLDTSFGEEGIAKFTPLSSYDYSIGADLLVQEDGKILVSGPFQENDDDTEYKYFIGRFNSDGSADNNFGPQNEGKCWIEYPEKYAVYDIYANGNDKFLVLYNDIDYGNTFTGVARYNSDGIIDNSFGENGSIEYTIDTEEENMPSNIEIAQDSTLLVISKIGSYSDGFYISVTNINHNGTINTDFGENGHYIYNTENKYLLSYNALDDENRIILSGRLTTDNGMRALLTRIYTGIEIYEALAEIEDSSLRVYPNPAADFINVKLDSDKTYTADIVDLNGRVIKTIDITSESKINISELESGKYLLILKNGNDCKVAKIIKE